tara:strand:- start:165 stop:443 length:279 start_codon:yes stop_codon:yes gene_type:complete
VKAPEPLVQHNMEIEQILPTPKPPLSLHHATRNLNADLQNVLTEQNSIMEEYVIPVKTKTLAEPLLNQAAVCEQTILQYPAPPPPKQPPTTL